MFKIISGTLLLFAMILTLASPASAEERKIIAPNGIDPSTPLSPGVATSNLVFTSGQLGYDEKTGKLVGDISSQTRLALESAEAVLKAAGTDMSKVIKTTVYLKDMNDFDAMNKVYAEFFKNGYPARSTVEVSRLALDALVEIEVIAVK